MVYHFGNQICPVCHKPVDMYSYTFDSNGKKIHLKCEEKNA